MAGRILARRTLLVLVISVLGLSATACIVDTPNGPMDCTAVPVAGSAIQSIQLLCTPVVSARLP